MRSSDFEVRDMGFLAGHRLIYKNVPVLSGQRQLMVAAKRLMIRGYKPEKIVELEREGVDILKLARIHRADVRVIKRGDKWWVILRQQHPFPFVSYSSAISFAHRKAER